MCSLALTMTRPLQLLMQLQGRGLWDPQKLGRLWEVIDENKDQYVSFSEFLVIFWIWEGTV